MRTVGLALSPGISLFEASMAIEVFGVDRYPSWYAFRVCGEPAVGRALGLPTAGLDGLAEVDTVVVPACRDVDEAAPPDLVAAVRAAHARGARIVALCTGAFVLAEAGLLDGRRATTHWLHAPALAERYPLVSVDPDVLYVDDGDVLTSAGKAAALDLCLHVVRLDHGATVANALARTLVVPPHRAGGQAQFINTPMPARRDHPLSDVLAWAAARLDQPLTVVDLARHANVSTRTLTRQFVATTGTTPLRWLLTRRVQRAQELLESTEDTVAAIAAATGLGTATTMRRHFHRSVGVPPDAYRRTFRR